MDGIIGQSIQITNGYRILKLIGEGSFGKVWLATAKGSISPCVVKHVNLGKINSKIDKELAIQEAKFLSQFNHPNIISFKESFLQDNGNVLSIVLEYAAKGDLSSHIANQKYELFSERRILTWFVEILSALFYLHSRCIVHRDLKTQNILLNSDDRIRLCDFGVAVQLKSAYHVARDLAGTPFYQSPEIWSGKTYNQKTDMWSLGCILYEMTTLEKPFPATSASALQRKIMALSFPPIPANFSATLQRLINSLLRKDPALRPSSEQLLRSNSLRQYTDFYQQIYGHSPMWKINTKSVNVVTQRHSIATSNCAPPLQPLVYIDSKAVIDIKKVHLKNLQQLNAEAPELLEAKVQAAYNNVTKSYNRLTGSTTTNTPLCYKKKQKPLQRRRLLLDAIPESPVLQRKRHCDDNTENQHDAILSKRCKKLQDAPIEIVCRDIVNLPAITVEQHVQPISSKKMHDNNNLESRKRKQLISIANENSSNTGLNATLLSFASPAKLMIQELPPDQLGTADKAKDELLTELDEIDRKRKLMLLEQSITSCKNHLLPLKHHKLHGTGSDLQQSSLNVSKIPVIKRKRWQVNYVNRVRSKKNIVAKSNVGFQFYLQSPGFDFRSNGLSSNHDQNAQKLSNISDLDRALFYHLQKNLQNAAALEQLCQRVLGAQLFKQACDAVVSGASYDDVLQIVGHHNSHVVNPIVYCSSCLK